MLFTDFKSLLVFIKFSFLESLRNITERFLITKNTTISHMFVTKTTAINNIKIAFKNISITSPFYGLSAGGIHRSAWHDHEKSVLQIF